MNREPTNWSDEKLEREIRRTPTDISLWNELFTRLQPSLFLRAKRVCNGNEAEAKDLVQEIFLAVLERLSNLERWNALFAYINGVAKNMFSQWIKRKQREAGLMALPTDAVEAELLLESIPSPGLEQGNQLIHEEVSDFVFHEIAAYFKRKPKHWTIIKLSKIEKRSHAEVMVRMGIRSAGASRKQLHQAVAALTTIREKFDVDTEVLYETLMRYYDEMSEES